MDFSTSNKTDILLYVFDFNVKEIYRRKEQQQRLFEWSTSLLLAAFGAVVALSGRSAPLPFPLVIKALATLMIAVPTLLFSQRIASSRKASAGNAKAVERIQETLRLFEDGYYGTRSPYPHEWEGTLAETTRKGRTTVYYVAILSLMAACVIAAIWLLL